MSRPPKPVRYEKKPMRRERGAEAAGVPSRARAVSVSKAPCAPKWRCKRAAFGQQLRAQVEQPRQRQPDDVEVVALDPRHQRGARALDRVAAGAALPLAGARRTSRACAASSGAEVHRGDLDRGRRRSRRRGRARSPPTTSCVRPARRATYSRACAASRGLPRMSPSSATIGVGAERRASPGDRERLAARVLLGHRARVAVASPPRRPRAGRRTAMPTCSRIARRCGERAIGERSGQARGRTAPPRAAPDSGESEPWTMFWPTAIAKSPRIEPGGGLERVGGADHLAGGLDRLARPRAPSRRSGRR